MSNMPSQITGNSTVCKTCVQSNINGNIKVDTSFRITIWLLCSTADICWLVLVLYSHVTASQIIGDILFVQQLARSLWTHNSTHNKLNLFILFMCSHWLIPPNHVYFSHHVPSLNLLKQSSLNFIRIPNVVAHNFSVHFVQGADDAPVICLFSLDAFTVSDINASSEH